MGRFDLAPLERSIGGRVRERRQGRYVPADPEPGRVKIAASRVPKSCRRSWHSGVRVTFAHPRGEGLHRSAFEHARRRIVEQGRLQYRNRERLGD
jgi:hypothetical protein